VAFGGGRVPGIGFALRPADLLVLERRDALLQPLDDGDEPEPVRKRQRLVRREIFLQRLRSSQYGRFVKRVPKFRVFLSRGGQLVDGYTVGCLSLIGRAGRGREVLAISYSSRTHARAEEVFDVFAILLIIGLRDWRAAASPRMSRTRHFCTVRSPNTFFSGSLMKP
jgi:hypothetical protein